MDEELPPMDEEPDGDELPPMDEAPSSKLPAPGGPSSWMNKPSAENKVPIPTKHY